MPSRVISHIDYDPVSLALRITFVSGLIYTYKNVPEKIYKELKNSGSKGVYLNQHIKPHYLYERVS